MLKGYTTYCGAVIVALAAVCTYLGSGYDAYAEALYGFGAAIGLTGLRRNMPNQPK